MEFEQSTVIISGACGVLGRAVARAFAAQGARLVLVDRNMVKLEQAFGPQTARSLLAPADLRDAAQLQAVADAALMRFGRIDVLCNIAGGFRMGSPVHATSDEDWDFLLDVNLRSLRNAVRACVPPMLAAGSGKIINVASSSAQKGAANMGAYCATKDAVIRLTESMAAELRDGGINVNAVLPSIIDTDTNRADMPAADHTRWVAPADLAQVILFLASPAARAIHGAALPVVGRV